MLNPKWLSRPRVCVKRVADLKNVHKMAKDYHERMDQSTNKEAFADELSKLQGMEDASSAVANATKLTVRFAILMFLFWVPAAKT